jgi:hypothetical protein
MMSDDLVGPGIGEPSPIKHVVMIIRHAEKPHPSGNERGIKPDGEVDRYSLTVNGWLRAGALVGLFAPARGEPPVGLHRPNTVYGPAWEDGHSKRSVETVMPLAARLGLDVITRYAAGEEEQLARELTTRPGATVVAWKHESIHKIVEHLGDVVPGPPTHWPADRYDVVWTFTRDDNCWRFAQVPQMLLPGDLPYAITDTSRLAQSTRDTAVVLDPSPGNEQTIPSSTLRASRHHHLRVRDHRQLGNGEFP